VLIDRAQLGRPLDGEVALITGAGGGIGREAAIAMARLGAGIIVAETSSSGRETQALIREAGGHALHVPVDVADPAGMELLMGKSLAWFNKVDIVINNAAVFDAKPLIDYTVEEWDRVMAVNLRGAFLAAKLFLPPMISRGHGVFVTMESGEGMPYMTPYFASKAALRSFASSLSQELGPESGVSVFCFGAGMVDTPGLRSALPQLSTLYRMPEAEFIRMSAPGGVLMSAEECGTGLVGCILHAAKLHGQETIAAAGLVMLGLRGAPGEVGPAVPIAVSGRTAEPLEHLIAELRAELDSLGPFQRQWYRRTLRQRTGMSLEEWEAAARQVAANPQSAGRYAENLKSLAAHFSKLESDARGYIRDETKLKEAIAVLEERRVAAEAAAQLS